MRESRSGRVAGNERTALPVFHFPLNTFCRVFDVALVTSILHQRAVLCEAQWHPKMEEDECSRQAPPRVEVYNPDYPVPPPNDKGQSSYHPCEGCVCVYFRVVQWSENACPQQQTRG